MGNRKNGFINQKKSNPILKQQEIEKKIKMRMFEARDAGVQYGTIATTLLFVHILYEDSRLEKDEIKDVINKLMNVSDFTSKELRTIPSIIKYMKEKHDYIISNQILIEMYPGIEGYLDPNEPDSEE